MAQLKPITDRAVTSTSPYTVHYFPSPNCLKVMIALLEFECEYTEVLVDLVAGQQLSADFAGLNFNHKVPVLVLADGQTMVESGAILEFLAEQHQQFLALEWNERWLIKQWLYWQMAGLGPSAGQAHHFRQFAPETIDYGVTRYTNEVNRLYGVLDRQLTDRRFVAGAYSIADMAIWPWILHHEWQGQSLSDFPAIARWFGRIAKRPAVRAALEKYPTQRVAPEHYALLLGQTASSIGSHTTSNTEQGA